MSDMFSISIKGILYYKGRYLLRKNQREEFELLGGKLETGDTSMEKRLHEEFLEESGINVRVDLPREPWLYIAGNKNILIFPFVCSVIDIPDYLFDEDGGQLIWFNGSELDTLNIPLGYLDSISDKIPRKSFSSSEGKFLKIIPNYIENKYEVIVSVKSLEGSIILEKPLKNFTAPRDLIKEHIKDKKIIAESTVIKGSSIYINYTAY